MRRQALRLCQQRSVVRTLDQTVNSTSGVGYLYPEGVIVVDTVDQTARVAQPATAIELVLVVW